MVLSLGSLVSNAAHRLTRDFWSWRRKRATQLGLSDLRSLRGEAQQMRRIVGAIQHEAAVRLTLPVIGSKAMDLPHKTRWAHRPELWSGPVDTAGIAAVTDGASLGRELKLFHDCKISELTLRQIRNTRREDMAPFGVAMDVYSFDGSFLSLAIDLPNDAQKAIRRDDLIRISLQLEMEHPVEIFGRVNLRHGPNVENLVDEFDLSGSKSWIEFDVFHSSYDDRKETSAWIDLIFEGPAMNRIILRDLVVLARSRALN
jgi:hypothetical protein